jgi:hypothetical protein
MKTHYAEILLHVGVVCVADHVGLGFRVVIVTDLDPE